MGKTGAAHNHIQMRIIHFLSNWKWTERSELVADMALAQQCLGETVTLVCGATPPENSGSSDVVTNARQKGLIDVMALPEMTKHWNVLHTPRSIKAIRRVIAEKQPDVVHCHMRHDHFLCGLTRRHTGFPLLVRSAYHPEHLGRDRRSRWCFRRATDGLIVVGEVARQSAVARGVAPEKIAVVEPGVDLERFSPERALPDNNVVNHLEDQLGDSFVAGVVSRIRKTRRLDIPLEAVYQLHREYPRLKLMVVGHGRPGAYEEVVAEPVRQMGLGDVVVRAGYCRGEDLVAAYRRMQVLLYPLPGTDKTCRTVREALACGVPVIASNMGFLPALIQDGENGYVVEPGPAAFADAMQRLLGASENQKTLSQGAVSLARRRFSMSRKAKKVLRFYKQLMK